MIIKNILFISSRADIGGGPLQMFDIISNIDRGRFTPFAALPDEEPFYNKIEAAGVKTLAIKKRSVSIADIIKLIKFVYSNNIDILHSHGKGAGIYSRLLKVFCPRLKVVHTFHGFHFDNMSKLKERLHKSTEKILARLTERFVSVSEGEQLQYASSGLIDFKKTVMIKNQVPLENLRRIDLFINSSEFGKFNILNNDGLIYFCAAARFDPVKQMPFLVESFARAAGNTGLCGSVKLLLIGDGEDYRKCRELADKMNACSFIEFCGERPDACEIMSMCDIYISASRREGLSMSMLEAITCGLPILAPRVAGIAELVRPYEKGVLFENNDYQSFEDGLKLIVKKYNETWSKTSMAEDFPKKYEDHKDYIKKYEKLYIETFNGR